MKRYKPKQKFECQACGDKRKYKKSYHHLLPRCHWGKFGKDKLKKVRIPFCRKCHRYLENLIVDIENIFNTGKRKRFFLSKRFYIKVTKDFIYHFRKGGKNVKQNDT